MQNRINKIIESVLTVIQEKFNGNQEFDCCKAYMRYVQENIVPILEFSFETDQLTIDLVVDDIIADEKKMWAGLSLEETKNKLNPNPLLWKFVDLSFDWFGKAKKALINGEFLVDKKQYNHDIAELSEIYKQISSIDPEFTSELFSESLLDIDFCYSKSSLKSLRLNRIVQ